MQKLGLIGYPLGHSWSPKVFEKFFSEEEKSDISYSLFPLKRLKDLHPLILNTPDLKGFNVTIPYKRDILSYLSETDPQAAAAGAVNTVLVLRNSKGYRLKGFNTDIYGFGESLHGRKFKAALILGNGGAAKALKVSLRQLGIPFLLVSRTAGPDVIHWKKLDKKIISHYDLIINSTPLGTFPDVSDIPPFPVEFLHEGQFVYDLIYNPGKTRFLEEAEKRGTEIKNGLEMLSLQAIQSWNIFKQNLS